MTIEDTILKAFAKQTGIPVTVRTNFDSNMVVVKGNPRKYEEFEISIPRQVILGLTRNELSHFVGMLLRGWMELNPEIFLDVNSNQIGIRIPYNVNAIDEIKAFIPPAARRWQGDTKTWFVNPSYLEQVERIIKKFYPNVKVTTPESALPAPVDGDEYGQLLRPLPVFALKAVYRAIAISCHPDRAVMSGLTIEQATNIMQGVNIAWTNIKKLKNIED